MMMKASLLIIAVLGCVSAKVIKIPPTSAPESAEGSVPSRTWSLEIKYNTSPADLNTDFEPPQPWIMKPVGEFSDVNLKNSIRIRVPNNFFQNARDEIYACGNDGSTRYFYLENLEGSSSVFTYPSKITGIVDDSELWEVDTSKRLEGYEGRKSVTYQFFIRPAHSTK
ncbi:uncharacterized protein LOC123271637 [Cotesia glomerata]|uniref:Uncharacterized protein n=1 Tax=Cotesia glomerata TaxID=32391 RepID=A0AAV7IQH3_COTGL|nr:uncharacterized protein LOC123271637 [Cotesia glomerata]KAH0557315.1 hypothetical protein KQX54_003920 [Cotesia glomerata]